MQITREQLNPTTTKLTILAEPKDLSDIKEHVLKRLAKTARLSGFRPGKAPLALVERNISSSVLQSEFLDEAINHLYGQAIDTEHLHAVGQPKVTLQKFVPFTTLDLEVETEAVGSITLPGYQKIKLAKQPVKISDEEIGEVISSLQRRMAERKDITRAAKDGDEVVIDFAGVDAKTKEPIKGADGKGYALLLGSNTFIPGFEANLAGLKAGEKKTFTLTFPGDYGVSALQNRKVIFDVDVKKVQELIEPVADDAFATKVGPFKDLKSLKADVRIQLDSEKQSQVEREYQDKLLGLIADKTEVAIPEALITQELERVEGQVKQNLAYRGQTWQEYLEGLGQTEDEYKVSLRETASKRVKAGLILSEVAEKEKISVTPEELKIRLQLLRGQYSDKAMRAELEKQENVRGILADMMTEKTIARLTEFANAA